VKIDVSRTVAYVEPVAGAQQPPGVRPGRVSDAAAAAELLTQYPLSAVGDHLVREPHELEPVGDQHGVGERLRDGGPVGRANVNVALLVACTLTEQTTVE
jgi:hypothetical protein